MYNLNNYLIHAHNLQFADNTNRKSTVTTIFQVSDEKQMNYNALKIIKLTWVMHFKSFIHVNLRVI